MMYIISHFWLNRHFNNFGFLYDPVKHSLKSMAPVFDTGNSLFYHHESIPQKNHLLDIKAASFCEKEVKMLCYVTKPGKIDFLRMFQQGKKIWKPEKYW